MRYLLDTNICLYLIKAQPKQVTERFIQCDIGDIGLSCITAAELWYGVGRSHHREQNHRALHQFLLPLVVVDFDAQAAQAYGELRAKLEQQGTLIGALDMLIGAQALSLGVTLITNNEREFARIPDLPIENWVR
jgi:tRNA(fMet)-specific endonuclease VapC